MVTLDDLMATYGHSPEWERSIALATADADYVDVRVPVNPIRRLRAGAVMHRIREKARESGVEGFLFACHGDSRDPYLAVFDRETGRLAGGIEGKNLFVLPDFRGKGLGPEVLVLAFEQGLRHPVEMNVANGLSAAGRRNRRKAHRIAVDRALASGLDVPEAVMAAYPDLAPAPAAP